MTLVSNLQKTSFTSVWYFKHYFFCFFPDFINYSLRFLSFSDTGDRTKLNELVIKVIDQQTCARQWQPTAILNTHICVGDGETGACSVSKI